MFATKCDKANRSDPIELRIKPQDCQNQKLKMIPARFDESLKSIESLIIGGFGKSIVIWRLSDVLKNITDRYSVKQMGE